MASALLISILVATVAIPMKIAGEPNATPKRGMQKMLRTMALFTTLWGLALAFFYFKLLYR